MATEVPHVWIDNQHKLDAFVDGLSHPALLAVDTEFMRRNTFYPELALLQVADRDRTALLDPLAFEPGDAFRQLMANPDNTCIMHSASEDMEALSDLLPHGPGRLFDTQIAAALVGMGPGLSYQKLVHQVVGIELDKGETRSNWLQRPLTASQRSYAALDVVHLHAVHDQLQTRLVELQRESWLQQDCARLCRRAERDQGDPQPQRKLSGAAGWPAEKQALLRRLLLWREHTARSDNTPRPWLFRDNQVLELIANPPDNLEQLRQAMRGQRAMRSRQCKALFEEICRPLEESELHATQAVPAAPDRNQRATLKSMKQAVTKVADELDIPSGLLCPRRLLQELLIEQHWPDELEGWRRPLLEPRLAPIALA